MPARRKPTKLLQLSGAFDRNPQRRRGETLTDSLPIGDVPAHLPDDVKSTWLELAEAAPTGLLAKADRITLEIAASLLAEFRIYGADMKAMRLTLLVRLLGMFGLNPINRASLDIPATPNENNPFLQDN